MPAVKIKDGMQSSWEVLTLLLKVTGTVFGVALVTLGVIILTKDPASRQAIARARSGLLVVVHFLCGIAAEYASLIKTACAQRVPSRAAIREALKTDEEQT